MREKGGKCVGVVGWKLGEGEEGEKQESEERELSENERWVRGFLKWVMCGLVQVGHVAPTPSGCLWAQFG